MPPSSPRDPIIPLMIILSFTTGLVDAVSVLGLGKVFTANMTGNVVFLGFAAAGAPGFSWLLYVLALAGFLLGAVCAGRLHGMLRRQGRRRWLLVTASIEAGLFFSSAMLASHIAPALQPEGNTSLPICLVIAATAAAMGLRNATARQLKVADLTTTVLTLTITGIASDSPLGGGSNPNFPRRLAAVIAILAGAFVGALMLGPWGLAPPLALAGICVLGATLTLARDEPKL